MHYLLRMLLATLAVLSLLVAAFGLFRFLIEVGESPMHYVIQDVGVFAAGVLGFALCWRQGKKLLAAREAALEQARRFSGHSLEASARLGLQIAGLAFFGLAAAGSTYLYLLRTEDWVLGLCAALFAVLFVLMLPLVISQHRGGRATLRLDGRGLEHAWFGQVPWTDVHGIFHQQQKIRSNTVHVLVLGVANPARYLERMPRAARLMQGGWTTPRGRYGKLQVPLNALDKDPFLVANAAAALRERVSPAPLKGWFPGMDEESIAVGLELAYLADNPDRLPPEEILRRMEAVEPRMQALTSRLRGRR